MKVLKFGGTSVGSAERIKAVAQLVNDGEPKIVVLSAMTGTTNKLVEISELLYKGEKQTALDVIQDFELCYFMVITDLFTTDAMMRRAKEVVQRIFAGIRSFVFQDFTAQQEKIILAQGELLSTNFMHLHFEEIGVKTTLLPALDYMRIDKDAEPDYFYIRQNLTRMLAEPHCTNLVITQGFICRDAYGEVSNLKRGGSDYSAALVGAAIRADEIQIWTDIDGIHNNDPRVVEHTVALRHLSFDEAAELAFFGAKILHPTSIQPAKKENIPVRLKNTLNPSDEGTLITGQSNDQTIKAVAAKDNVTVINIKSTHMLLAYGFLRKVFEVFEKWQTPIDMIATSEVAVSLTIDDTCYLNEIIESLQKYGTIEVERNLTIVCVVGDFAPDQPGLAGCVLSALGDVPVRMISHGGSEHNISIVVKETDKSRALNNLSNNLLNCH